MAQGASDMRIPRAQIEWLVSLYLLCLGMVAECQWFLVMVVAALLGV
jgi:hypothetical protein